MHFHHDGINPFDCNTSTPYATTDILQAQVCMHGTLALGSTVHVCPLLIFISWFGLSWICSPLTPASSSIQWRPRIQAAPARPVSHN